MMWGHSSLHPKTIKTIGHDRPPVSKYAGKSIIGDEIGDSLE